MADDQQAQQTNPAGGDESSSEKKNIVGAIDSFKSEYGAQGNNQNNHTYNTFIWTRRAAFGVFIYTALTFGVVVISLCQLHTSRDTERRDLRAYVFFGN